MGLNHTAIGIEHVGTSDGQVLANRRQLAASLRLTRELQGRYRIPARGVIGHNESLASCGPVRWEAWTQAEIDAWLPGASGLGFHGYEGTAQACLAVIRDDIFDVFGAAAGCSLVLHERGHMTLGRGHTSTGLMSGKPVMPPRPCRFVFGNPYGRHANGCNARRRGPVRDACNAHRRYWRSL